jgi:phage/plasmid-associated DNA primase
VSHALEAIRLRALGFHPIVERTNSKMPAEMSWQKLVSRTDEELRRVFEQMPEGGIGTVTHGFVVIDVDVRPDKDGSTALFNLETEHGALPRTLTSKTPSGGRHLFFRVPTGVEIRNSVSKIGPGIDIRGTGGQVVLPPTSIDGKAYAWLDAGPDGLPHNATMADLPATWLKLLQNTEAPARTPSQATAKTPSVSVLREAKRLRAPSDVAFEAERRARYMATVNEPSIQGSSGNAVMMRAAFHAKEMSRNTGEALAALLEWNARCASPEWSEDELLRALQNSEGVFGKGLDREREKTLGASSSGEADPADGRPSPAQDVAWVESMQAYVAKDRKSGTWNLSNPLSERGAQMALVARGLSAAGAKAALKNCECVIASTVECDPTQGPTFEREGQLVLNNYVPPTLKPQSGGDFRVLGEVLSFLTCFDENARRWLVNWMAFAVQNPARPMRTVPVVYGAQRTGKSLLARAMMTMLGEQNCATIRNEDVKGKFTSHFVTKLFVAVSEIEAGEVTHATSTLKYLTGEPQLVHEAKGSAAFYQPNRIKMLCNSNQTLPVCVEGEGDSRWVLFRQLEKPSPEYSARMDSLFDKATNDWSAKGRSELSAFLAYLLAFPVDVELARSVHINAARASAVEASRSSVEQFVEAVNGSSLDAVWMAHVPDYDRSSSQFDNIDIEGHGHLTGAAAVYATYRAFCKASGLQALGMGRFPGEMERHASAWKRHKVSASVMATRPWAYTGLPRDRRLRAQYLPAGMRQASLFTGGETLKDVAEKADVTPVMAETIAAVQSVFGLENTEEEEAF